MRRISWNWSGGGWRTTSQICSNSGHCLRVGLRFILIDGGAAQSRVFGCWRDSGSCRFSPDYFNRAYCPARSGSSVPIPKQTNFFYLLHELLCLGKQFPRILVAGVFFSVVCQKTQEVGSANDSRSPFVHQTRANNMFVEKAMIPLVPSAFSYVLCCQCSTNSTVYRIVRSPSRFSVEAVFEQNGGRL